jgi:O-antigen ligase
VKESLYILFLISGMLQSFLIYFNKDLPLTPVLMIILLFILLKDFYKNKFKVTIDLYSKYSLAILYLFLVWMFVSTLYTSSQFYFLEKIFRFLAIILSFAFPILSLNFSIDKFYKYFILIVFFMSVIYIPLFFQSYGQYILIGEADSIYSSYLVMGYIIAASIIMVTFTESITIYKYKLIIILTLLGSLVITGARGPLVFLIISIFFYLAYKMLKINFRVSKKQIKFLLSLLSILVLTMPLIANNIDINEFLDRTVNRLFSLQDISGDASAGDRVIQAKFVIDSIDIKNIFFGHGIGSYGMERLNQDIRLYPHNMILEVLFELGLVGLFIFLIYIILIVKRITVGVHFMLFLYLILNSLKSLSFVDNRLMFGMFGIFLLVSIKNNVKKKLNL